MEQRIRDVAGVGKRGRDTPVGVSQPVQELEDALEQDHTRSDLQCAQAVHGDESEIVRRMHAAVQARKAEVSFWFQSLASRVLK